MNTRRSPMLYYVVNAVLIGACLLQAALCYSDPQCQSPHGAQCNYPLPPGCDERTYPDVPDRCCYMAWSRKCCQMDRTKHVYEGSCPGLPTNCSDCKGEVISYPYAECTTAGSGEGYCE